MKWDWVCYYANPLRYIPGQEWGENWYSFPHCNGQGGCWMHYCTERAWCKCACGWCRIARLVRPHYKGRKHGGEYCCDVDEN